MNLKNFIQTNKGITLIALVITIIVLLILAGVTIATLTGDNGILSRASEAKEKTQISKENELRRLTALEAATNIEDTTHTETITQTGTDGMEETKTITITIPAGFAVSQVDGENSIEDGLVIIDKNGNEFVWIPVSKEDFDTQFQRRAGYYDGSLQAMTNYGEANSTGNNTNTGVTESETTQKEAQEMYQSVYDNEGFYIGRYEAGKDSSGNVVIQKGVNVYNNITWSKNGQMNEESSEISERVDGISDGAIELSRNFDTENGYTTVTSTLCYGVQWDVTLTWIDPEYTGFAKDSTGKGYHNSSSPTTTGSNSDYAINNIYDLAGNVFEWTMESYSTNCRSIRGGSCSSSGSVIPASNRSNSFQPFLSYPSIGFRISLYL